MLRAPADSAVWVGCQGCSALPVLLSRSLSTLLPTASDASRAGQLCYLGGLSGLLRAPSAPWGRKCSSYFRISFRSADQVQEQECHFSQPATSRASHSSFFFPVSFAPLQGRRTRVVAIQEP